MPAGQRRAEAGFTLLMVVFMVAAMIIAAAAVASNLLTQGRREKEREMVWRGQQYARAIGLYYRKFGKYPTKIEDLTRPTNGVRFLRQSYKDPMNAEDGSWRFIYVGPNGQLIGSLRQTNLLQNALNMPAASALSAFGGMQAPGIPGASPNQTNGAQGIMVPGAGVPGVGAPGQQNTNPAATANPLESQPQGLDGEVLGGNIIGVGSKIKKPSIRVYLGGDTYQQWEFIWNPVGQVAVPGQTGVNPNANPTGAANGVAPNANNPYAPGPGGMNPGGANPNGTNPNPPDGQQPPVVNMPPPTQ
jgi:hypothetical protein